MKYIVMLKEDAVISARIPLAGMLEAVEATRPYLEELKKRERVAEWGFYGAGHGLFAVLNVRSHAELHEVTELLPIRAFCSIECWPVMESGEFTEVFAKIKREALAWNEKLAKPSNRSNY